LDRIDKINYYLNIAEECLRRGTCLRRNFGAVIVKNDQIVSTGYTGSPRGTPNCCDIGWCIREEMKVPRGTQYELCRSVHAEMNAIIHASRNDMLGSVLYLCGVEKDSGHYIENAMPCKLCVKMIINAGIERVVVRKTKTEYEVYEVRDWVVEDDSIDVNKAGAGY